MSRLASLATATAFAVAVLALPAVPAFAAGSDTPSSSGTKSGPSDKSKEKNDKKSERDFINGYKTAYATIYERGDYAGGIAALKALGRDGNADVANLIGYANRKLGNVAESQVWYEAALTADPTHVRTWQYYGLWQIEQGRGDQARLHLNKIGALCGTACPEYRSLAEALDITATGGRLVY
jgi:tetratricopeptide (TPR) repeat protein